MNNELLNIIDEKLIQLKQLKSEIESLESVKYSVTDIDKYNETLKPKQEELLLLENELKVMADLIKIPIMNKISALSDEEILSFISKFEKELLLDKESLVKELEVLKNNPESKINKLINNNNDNVADSIGSFLSAKSISSSFEDAMGFVELSNGYVTEEKYGKLLNPQISSLLTGLNDFSKEYSDKVGILKGNNIPYDSKELINQLHRNNSNNNPVKTYINDSDTYNLQYFFKFVLFEELVNIAKQLNLPLNNYEEIISEARTKTFDDIRKLGSSTTYQNFPGKDFFVNFNNALSSLQKQLSEMKVNNNTSIKEKEKSIVTIDDKLEKIEKSKLNTSEFKDALRDILEVKVDQIKITTDAIEEDLVTEKEHELVKKTMGKSPKDFSFSELTTILDIFYGASRLIKSKETDMEYYNILKEFSKELKNDEEFNRDIEEFETLSCKIESLKLDISGIDKTLEGLNTNLKTKNTEYTKKLMFKGGIQKEIDTINGDIKKENTKKTEKNNQLQENYPRFNELFSKIRARLEQNQTYKSLYENSYSRYYQDHTTSMKFIETYPEELKKLVSDKVIQITTQLDKFKTYGVESTATAILLGLSSLEIDNIIKIIVKEHQSRNDKNRIPLNEETKEQYTNVKNTVTTDEELEEILNKNGEEIKSRITR